MKSIKYWYIYDTYYTLTIVALSLSSTVARICLFNGKDREGDVKPWTSSDFSRGWEFNPIPVGTILNSNIKNYAPHVYS